MKMASTIIWVAIIAVLASAQLRAQNASVARIIDSLASEAVTSNRMSSVSVAVVRGNDTVLLRAYGLARRDIATPAAASTVYRLGSVTKQFTAATALQLVDERRISLDDTLGKFLVWVPEAWKAVTLRQLLNHTSGIPSYTNLGPVWSKRIAEDFVPDSLIALTVGRPLDFPVGSNWRYNNSGYVILGRILEVVEGKPYAAIIADRIAKPLRLTSLRYCPTNPVPATDAFGYDVASRGSFAPSAVISMTQPFAAGALCSTARDLVKWNVALHGGKVISKEAYALMTTPEGAAVRTRYGFGISRDSSVHGLRLAHGGGVNGFVSTNSYVPSVKQSVVVLSNTATGEVDRLAAQIERVLNGEPLLPRAKRIAVAQLALQAYVGKYELVLPGRTMPVIVTLRDGNLEAAFGGQSPSVLVPIGEHAFMVELDEEIRVTFSPSGDGFELLQGVPYRARRISN